MKVSLLLAFFLLSCSQSNEIPTENVIPRLIFTDILKDIHLAKSSFEVNKNGNIEKAERILSNSYLNIFKKNNVSETHFLHTLEHYSKKPQELEKIYENILGNLNKERPNLDLK